MLNIFTSISKSLKLTEGNQPLRAGTKLAALWLGFTSMLICWLVVGIPVITIYYPHMEVFAPVISPIVAALIGGAAMTYSTNEVRKTYENVKMKKEPPKKNQEESPTSPFIQS